MTRSLALLSTLALLGLAACDEMPMPTEPDGGIGDGGGLPMPTEPDGGIGDGAGLPIPTEPDGGIGDGAGPGDTCGLAEVQDFIGENESVVMATVFVNPTRIIHPGDSVTMDFNPERINFRVGPGGLIEQITCG